MGEKRISVKIETDVCDCRFDVPYVHRSIEDHINHFEQMAKKIYLAKHARVINMCRYDKDEEWLFENIYVG